MHTTHELSTDAFEFRVDGAAVDSQEVMPAVGIDDRLGVVLDDPADGLGAGNFILVCVTAFYERLRETREDFYEYPDYYTFQATPSPADYLEFDIWPNHKNISVTPEPEEVLRAINDRAVNLLVVPDDPHERPAIDQTTENSIRRRAPSCFAYSPDGHLADPDFALRVPRAPVWQWYEQTLDALDSLSASIGTVDDTHLTQEFREIDLEAALARLPTDAC